MGVGRIVTDMGGEPINISYPSLSQKVLPDTQTFPSRNRAHVNEGPGESHVKYGTGSAHCTKEQGSRV